MDRYIEIWWNGKQFDVNIRWLDGEQHEYYEVATIEEVNEITNKFLMEGSAG